MAVRTREKLIEVAKQVFLQKGVENTTIADIANASDKGRRTIYTYFKSKIEIYDAVVERDSEDMVRELRAIAESDRLPETKLNDFLLARISPAFNRNTSSSRLKALLRIDFRRTQRIRKKASEKEEEMLKSIIDEGIALNKFNPEMGKKIKDTAYTIIRALDLYSANENMPEPPADFISNLVNFISHSLTK